MKKILKLLLLTIFLVNLQNFLYATQGTFGSEIFIDENGNKQMYSKICVQPEFKVWNFGVGLDLQLYLDENGNLREEDWDGWEDVINKILYVRYGQKGDPLYVNFGGIMSASVGHGIIFNRYSNMIRYPEVKKVGLIFDINRETWGLETITTNLIRQEVMGARFYYRPFHSSSMFLLSNLAIGVSAGTDIDPDDSEGTKDDEVSVVSLDVELPLLTNPVFSSTLFTDVAQMDLGEFYLSNNPYTIDGSLYIGNKNPCKNNGTGFATGFLGKLLVFDYKVVYKNLDNNFIYGYFDRFYEIDRSYKGNTISSASSPKKEGVYGELAYNLMQKIFIMGSYEDLKNDQNDIYPWVHAQINVDKSLLLNKFFFNFSYDKKKAQNWDKIKDLEGPNTLATTELGYGVADNVMLVIIKQRTFDANGDEITKTKIETRIVF
jgi:hypothetical protein